MVKGTFHYQDAYLKVFIKNHKNHEKFKLCLAPTPLRPALERIFLMDNPQILKALFRDAVSTLDSDKNGDQQ